MAATIPIKCRPVFGFDQTPWVSKFGVKRPCKRGDFDAIKEKADHDTVASCLDGARLARGFVRCLSFKGRVHIKMTAGPMFCAQTDPFHLSLPRVLQLVRPVRLCLHSTLIRAKPESRSLPRTVTRQVVAMLSFCDRTTGCWFSGGSFTVKMHIVFNIFC